jgi:hypothetical protein
MNSRQSSMDSVDGTGLDGDEARRSNKPRRGNRFWAKIRDSSKNTGVGMDFLNETLSSFEDSDTAIKKLLEEALSAAFPASPIYAGDSDEAKQDLAKDTSNDGMEVSLLQFALSTENAAEKAGDSKRANKPSVDMMDMAPPPTLQADHEPMLKLWRSRPYAIVYGIVTDWSR